MLLKGRPEPLKLILETEDFPMVQVCVEWGSVAGKRPGASQTGNSRVSRWGSVRRSGREQRREKDKAGGGGGARRRGKTESEEALCMQRSSK